MLKKTHRLRLLLLTIGSMLIFTVILFRLYEIQVRQHLRFQKLAESQQNQTRKLIPHRGDILDRNGLKLATSYVSDTIYLDTRKYHPAEIEDEETTVDSLTSESTSPWMRSVKEKLARQQAKEHAKDKAQAEARLAKKNKNKHRAWDDEKVDPQLLDDLAEALATTEAPLLDDDAKTTGAAAPARMSHEHALEVVEKMFTQKRLQKFYTKAPETLTEKMEAIERKYALPQGFIVYEKYSKRFYPNGSLASHLVGYTGLDGSGDNVGASGIEREYDNELKGRYAQQSIQISSGQHGLAPLSDSLIDSTYGNNVVLTIDQQLQMYTEQALFTQVNRYQALGGIALVMDVHSGEILAMASCPDFDLNNFSKSNPAQMRNRNLTDPIEIGSVMKIITATLAMDRGLVSPEEIINCSGPKFFPGRKKAVKDVHSVGTVPFRTAFAESSNVGLVTVGMRLEPAAYYRGLIKFGLGQQTKIDLPGENKGIFHDFSEWSMATRSSLPMGYEAGLTPIQVIAVLGAVGNDGVRLRPHLLKHVRSIHGEMLREGETQTVDRVAAPETCKTIRGLMEAVVLEGTGKKNAQIPGYRVGGKTGTTVKYNSASADEEHRKYYASFAGLLPIDEPRFAIYCYVDEPQGAKYGGDVAAPIFREIALATARIFGIPPSDPVAFQMARFDGITPLNDQLVTSSGVLNTTSTLMMAQAEQKRIDEKAHAQKAMAQPALPMMAAAMTEPVAAGTLDAKTSATWARIFATDTKAKPAPDLHGQTMRDAFSTLAEAGFEARMIGSGRAVAQQPPAGAPVHAGDRIEVTFMFSSQKTDAPKLNLSRETAAVSQKDGEAENIQSNSMSRVEHVTLRPPANSRTHRDNQKSAGKPASRAAE